MKSISRRKLSLSNTRYTLSCVRKSHKYSRDKENKVQPNNTNTLSCQTRLLKAKKNKKKKSCIIGQTHAQLTALQVNRAHLGNSKKKNLSHWSENNEPFFLLYKHRIANRVHAAIIYPMRVIIILIARRKSTYKCRRTEGSNFFILFARIKLSEAICQSPWMPGICPMSPVLTWARLSHECLSSKRSKHRIGETFVSRIFRGYIHMCDRFYITEMIVQYILTIINGLYNVTSTRIIIRHVILDMYNTLRI